ncbi:MAG: thioredoxin family protein [Planctomycetaceae bacterium]|jgi:thiol-disulfide isomerase/thioredoxin
MDCVSLRVMGLLLFAAATAVPQSASAQGVQWQTDPPAALQQAAATGRPVLMKFTAEWCSYCKKMERTTFSDPTTAEVVHRDFVPLLIDADKHQDLARQLNVTGLPAILIVAPDLTILERITGYQTTQKLLPKLELVTATHRTNARVPALPAAQQRTQLPGSDNPFADNPFANEQTLTSDPADESARGSAEFHNVRRAATEPSFDGLCLTSVVEERELIAGSNVCSAEYRGQLLYFRDIAQRSLFFESPEKYWPMLDGSCALTLLETGREVPGKLRHAAVFRNRIWLFQNRALMAQFIESPADHVARLEERQIPAGTANRSY